jgi:hypothetical protein
MLLLQVVVFTVVLRNTVLVSWHGRQSGTNTVTTFKGLMRFKLVSLIRILLILDF